MAFRRLNGAVIHYELHGGEAGRRPIVFANSLGTDLRIWDGVRSRLDPAIPLLLADKRGHGLSDLGAAAGRPGSMEDHVADLAALMDGLGLSDALCCGVSVGGMIAQGLAAARPDLCAGLVLSNTGARIGNAEGWNARIAAISEGGMAAVAGTVIERWFSPTWRRGHPDAFAGYRNMLERTPPAGYIGVCEAIRDAAFTASSAALRLPTLCIAGSADLSTPPGLVRGLAELIGDASFHCLDDVGHLPCLERPEEMAGLIADHYGRCA